MTRDRLKYAACAAVGYQDGSREHSVAQVAMDAALDAWPGPIREVGQENGVYYGFTDKQKRKQRKFREREEKALYEETKRRTFATVRADPQSYGFVGIIGLVMLLWQIGSIVWPIIRWLMDKRYEGQDGEIQAAISARGP
jgi:hypothetical protein